MILSLSIPEGHHIMAFESSISSKGATHYRIYLREDGRLDFAGAEGFDPQQVLNQAFERLKAKRIVPQARFNLDLSVLKRS